MNRQVFVATAVAIGLTLLCLLGINWIGPSGAFLNLLTPLPAAYLALRFGLRSGIVVVVVTSLLLQQLATTYTLLAYLGLFGSSSLLLPYYLQRRQPWDRALLFSTLGAFALTIVILAVVMAVTGSRLQGLVDQVINAEVEQSLRIYQDAGFSAGQLKEMRKVTTTLADFIRGSFYGLYAAALVTIQALCLLLLQRLKKDYYQIAGVPFAQWRLPAGLIWGLICSGFALLLPVGFVAQVGRSLLVILLPLYFFQGMAVAASFLQAKTYPPLVKGLIYLMLLVLNPLPIIITGVGVFDLWIDFRRPRRKNN